MQIYYALLIAYIAHTGQLDKSDKPYIYHPIAVSHAIRAAYQVKEILTEGNITFPLREAEYIKTVKAGKFDYLTEVAPKLEAMIAEVEELSKASKLPEKVDGKEWDFFIYEAVRNSMFEGHDAL